MNDEIKSLGEKLVEEASLKEEFSFNRGLIDELFPYIYEASKRMSSRGISQWLKGNDTKLSAATIARALRDPAPYWQDLFEPIEPAAEFFATVHGISSYALVLADINTFEYYVSLPPGLATKQKDGVYPEYDVYEDAKQKLRAWYDWPESSRIACLACVGLEEESPATNSTTTPPVQAEHSK